MNSNKAIRDDREFAKWVEERLSGSLAYISNLMNLINVLIPKYLNEPGKPADLKGLHYVAITYSRIYESFVNWTMETLGVSVADNQKEIRDALAGLTSGVIELIWNFPFRFRDDILDAKRRLRAGESNITIRIDLVLEVPPGKMERFNNLFRKFKRFI